MSNTNPYQLGRNDENRVADFNAVSDRAKQAISTYVVGSIFIAPKIIVNPFTPTVPEYLLFEKPEAIVKYVLFGLLFNYEGTNTNTWLTSIWSVEDSVTGDIGSSSILNIVFDMITGARRTYYASLLGSATPNGMGNFEFEGNLLLSMSTNEVGNIGVSPMIMPLETI